MCKVFLNDKQMTMIYSLQFTVVCLEVDISIFTTLGRPHPCIYSILSVITEFALQGYRDGYHLHLAFSNFLSAEPLGTFTLYISYQPHLSLPLISMLITVFLMILCSTADLMNPDNCPVHTVGY